MARDPFNYHWIEDNRVMAGSMPTYGADIDTLYQSFGIRAILSLTRRSIIDCPDIAYLVQAYPIQNYHAPIADHYTPNEAILHTSLAFIEQSLSNNQPIYVHCRGGIGRTGTILIAYYVLRCGLTIEEARQRMRVRWNYQRVANAADQGSPQREWIDALEMRRNGNL